MVGEVDVVSLFPRLKTREKVRPSASFPDQQQQQQQLAAPLLDQDSGEPSEEYCDEFGMTAGTSTMAAATAHNNNLTTATTTTTTTGVATPHRFAMAEHHHGGVLHRILFLRCAADVLPTMFYTIATNGKVALVALLGVYSLLLSLFVPFWLLSFVVTEWGVYALAVGIIFLIGRAIVRVIAFPGASHKVVTEIEREFAKYSVRMIAASCQSLCELAALFEPREQVGAQNLDKRTLHQLPGAWRRVASQRDRILGMYVDVLRYVYQQDSVLQLSLSISSENSQGIAATTARNHGLTGYGNNRLTGDIGGFSTLPVRRDCVVPPSLFACCASPLMFGLEFVRVHSRPRLKQMGEIS
jgi:hypothetical protein